MAENQNKVATGGNKPKPAGGSGGSSGQSAKDRSRAQSRPVSGKAPTTKAGKASGAGGAAGGSKGGNRPRPGGQPAPQPTTRRFSGAMMAWAAVGLVVVIVAVLVVVKVLSGSTTSTAYTPVKPAPASVVQDVTNIPASVYDTVGINSSTVAVTPPTIAKGKPPLSLGGKSPAMFFYGAEYCPYCAAERWALTAALSRFGTWSGLKITASSHTDVDPTTHTFSYHGATFTSPYLTFKSVEAQSNVPTASGSYGKLEPVTAQEQKILTTYNVTGYPFVNINNLAFIEGPSYDPGILANLSWSQIAGGLSDPSNPATQAIVATANYISAAICASTTNAPASVCNSSGVQAAAKALKLS